MTESVKRLARLLQSYLDDKGKYKALERQTDKLGKSIHRHTFQKIVMHEKERERVALTFPQLEALDALLKERFRASLSSLFEKASLLHELVARDLIRILLGSQPRREEMRTDLSRWDILAMQTLFSRISKIRSVELDLLDILFSWPTREPLPDWALNLDAGAGKMSAVSIGSPRASPATELMLARMFGVKPFVKPVVGDEPNLPFRFIWETVRPSAFCRSIDEVKGLLGRQKRSVNRDRLPWALERDGQYNRLERFVPQSKTYGVLAAQRRGEQIWLVIAGLSGPGTAAAAEYVDYINLRLPAPERGKPAPVVWMTVEADVKLDPKAPGDHRSITGQVKVLSEPEAWYPES